MILRAVRPAQPLGPRTVFPVLSNWSKDNLVAPEMSTFAEASIPPAPNPGRANYWILNHVLNSMLRARFTGKLRPFAFNYLRRAESAYREYELARQNTEAYLRREPDKNDGVGLYMAAMHHWEGFLGQAYHALRLYTLNQKRALFEKGDGSTNDRLSLLYNESKHAESVIDAGELPEESTMCIWLKNHGLHSPNSYLTFDELGIIVTTLGQFADALQDPAQAGAALQAIVNADAGEGPEELAASESEAESG